MSWWDAIILGIVQGLTEFFPISSSGHLVLFQTLIPGFQQPGVFFDAWLHAATLLAVVLYFYRDIIAIVRALLPGSADQKFFGWTASDARWLVILLLVASIPAGIVGITLRHKIEETFQSVLVVGIDLVITGCILFLASRFGKGEKKIGNFKIMDALWVGLAQAVALLPGISRSGTTISMGMFRELKGEEAVKFSFLLSLPAVAGAVLLEGLKNAGQVHSGELTLYGLGFVASVLTGILTISLILRIVKNNHLKGFAYYCWVVGLLAVLVNLAGWR
ncbi:MAG: undecaprenyl-diphosphate phosphatase [bacterium]|nr:undecaprenyl-diphosphate phosphatase [bacterium]